MKILSWTAGAAAAFSLTQCAPETGLSPVADVAAAAVTSMGPVTTTVQDPSGSRLEYTDTKGNQYVYKLYEATGYTLTKVSPRGRVLNEQHGRWSYQKTGEKTGKLTFDGAKTWELRFTSPHRANAKRSGYTRIYRFEFEWM
jgi:hypothetical protein